MQGHVFTRFTAAAVVGACGHACIDCSRLMLTAEFGLSACLSTKLLLSHWIERGHSAFDALLCVAIAPPTIHRGISFPVASPSVLSADLKRRRLR